MKTLNDQIEEMPEKVSLSVFDRIKALLSPDERFKALQASFDALTAEHKQSAADLVTAKASLATAATEAKDAKTALAAMTAERDALKTKLATAEASVTDFDAKVAKRAQELAAAQGIQLQQLPTAPAGGAENPDKQKARAAEEYMALHRAGKSIEAGQYWEKNKALLS